MDDVSLIAKTTENGLSPGEGEMDGERVARSPAL